MLPVNRIADGINSAKGQRRAMRRPLRAVAAQQNLAQQIDLNSLHQTPVNVPPQILPSDPRVWSVWPQQLTVSSRLDVSSTALFTATGVSRLFSVGPFRGTVIAARSGQQLCRAHKESHVHWVGIRSYFVPRTPEISSIWFRWTDGGLCSLAQRKFPDQPS